MEQDKIVDAFKAFFCNLFSSEHGLENQKALDDYLKLIPRKLSEEDASTLDKDILVQELDNTIFSLANGKSLGLDGLPANFYKNLDWISLVLREVYLDAFEKGS